MHRTTRTIAAGAAAMTLWALSGALAETGVPVQQGAEVGVDSAPTPDAYAVAAPGTGFTYQGVLEEGGVPVTTPVDVRFTLYSDAGGTVQVGAPITVAGITPVDGVFSAALDFGVDAYTDNQARWLRLEVSPAGAGTYDDLGLQPLDATPFALNTRGLYVNEYEHLTLTGQNDITGRAVLNIEGGKNGNPWFAAINFNDEATKLWGVGKDQFNDFYIDNNTNGGRQLTISQTTNNVGLGTASPTSKLTVAGTIESTSGGVTFPDGSTQPNAAVGYRNANEHLMLGPGSYTGAVADAQYFSGMYMTTDSQLHAPIHLPVGAEIVSYTVYVNDTVVENLRVTIAAKANSGTSAFIHAAAEIIGNSGYFSQTVNTPGLILNDTQAYFLLVHPQNGVGTGNWQGIDLTLQNVDIVWRMP